MTPSEYPGRDGLVTTYFSGKAERYSRHRPSYPKAAVAWVLEHVPEVPVIADVGAGTGIASRLFADAGARVIAIEPNDAMRSEAIAHDERHATPKSSSIDYRAGTAEATGLDDGSVDGIACAQAFHWFETEPTLAEFHRIARPGGILALMWNIRSADSREADATYERIMARARAHAESRGRIVQKSRDGEDLEDNPFFTVMDRRMFPNPVSYSREELLGRVQSASYFPDHGPQAEAMERAINECFDHYQSEGRLTLHQQCRVILARRRDEAADRSG